MRCRLLSYDVLFSRFSVSDQRPSPNLSKSKGSDIKGHVFNPHTWHTRLATLPRPLDNAWLAWLLGWLLGSWLSSLWICHFSSDKLLRLHCHLPRPNHAPNPCNATGSDSTKMTDCGLRRSKCYAPYIDGSDDKHLSDRMKLQR
jgi:hypothetical protein